MLLHDHVSSKRRRSSDGSKADAICLTVNLRRSDVCNEAILECHCPILFLLNYDGLVMVRKPMQFFPLLISVGQMFVLKQFWYVLSDLVFSEIRRSSDGLKADAICLTVNLRRSDVCSGAILKCYCPILFLLKYVGLVIVRKQCNFSHF